MGSGLILLVIVAAWLAVLVPMALRSHESTTSLSSVDRFSDAMRVLSRRDPARGRGRSDGRWDEEPSEDVAGDVGAADDWDDDRLWDDTDDGAYGGAWREHVARICAPLGAGVRAVTGRLRRGDRRPVTPVVRRRRLLGTLLALAVVTLVLGLVGPRVLLAVHGASLVALALFVVQLRRLAVQRARSAGHRPRTSLEAPARPLTPSVRVSPADVHGAEPAAASSGDPADDEAVFDQTAEGWDEPEPAAPAVVAASSTAARYDDPMPVAAPPAAALGGAWSPVPVPVPTYVTAPVAPARAQRVVDLTRPGDWSEKLPEVEHAIEGDTDDGDVVERRRAVNDW